MSTFKRSKLLMQEDLEKRARKRKMYGGGRTNLLEELGRVDAEKAYTPEGKRNLKDEKDRIIGELGHGVKNRNRRRLYKKKGGHVKSRGKAVRGGGAEIK